MKVGLIGCGRIANEAHLPAYKKYGVVVSSICDIESEKAKKLAEAYDVNHFTTVATELASRNDVELIDIATRPENRKELILQLLPFNKPLLIQKPITYSLEEAIFLHETTAKAGIPIAINHNARWAPNHQELYKAIQSGTLGNIYAIHHINRFNENLDTWYTQHPDYMFIDHGLHYLDLVRYHTGKMPVKVSAISHANPNQKAQCPLMYSINLVYPDQANLTASLYFNNSVPIPHGFDCRWYIDGSKGNAILTIDSISLMNDAKILKPMTRLKGNWVPEGFIGAYNALVQSIKYKTKPSHTLEDHIETLKVAVAAARSAQKGGKFATVEF